jgi:hypothetical protein
MHRGGRFPLQRLGTNVLLRDLTLWLAVSDMQAGRLVSYCDLLGYDEVAHHAGPAGLDALADPLTAFPPSPARYLARLSGYASVPDVVVNSTLYDAEAGEVAAFEELIGCHGGAGGMQTQPFLLHPAARSEAAPSLEGAEQVHAFLARHIYPETAASAAAVET